MPPKELSNTKPREELFVVLEYMFKFCYDKDHTLKKVDLIAYAKNHYGMNIRKEVIGDILEHLEILSNSNKMSLPFKIGSVQLKVDKRYYIKEYPFKDYELASIVSAINNSQTINNIDAEKLSEKLLNKTTTIYKKGSIMEKASIAGDKSNFNKVDSKLYKAIAAGFKNEYIKFRIINIIKVYSHDKPRFYSLISNEAINLEAVEGILCKTVYENNIIYAVIYFPSYKLAVITDFDNIDILTSDAHLRANKINYEIQDTKYKPKEINKWISDHFSGQDGKLVTLKLKVVTNQWDFNFRNFKRNFKDYWKKDFECTIVERDDSYKEIDEDGKEVIIHRTAYDAFFELTCNKSRFDHWYLDLGNYYQVVILEPASLNDYYLMRIINKLSARINKYGAKYDLEISKNYKQKYIDLLEQEKKDVEYKEDKK